MRKNLSKHQTVHGKQLAFTLIELLVVIAIIGILSGIILVSMSGSTESARIAKLRVFGNSVRDVLGANLVSEWKFDGDGADTWSNKTLTLVNSPTSTSGCPQNSCYTLNGTTQYAYVADDALFNFGDKMSVFLWVKGGANKDNNIISQYNSVGNQRGWILYPGVGDGTIMRVYISADGTATAGQTRDYYGSQIILDNAWHLIGFTFNAGTLKLYRDGIEDTSVTKNKQDALTIYNSTADIMIGAQSGLTGYFNGSIDEVRLYNAAIPTSQIRENYLAGIKQLLAKGGITQDEYNQRIASLRQNISVGELN